MEVNVGVIDGAFRILAGLLLLGFSYGETAIAPGLLAWPGWLLGLALGLTGLFHFCPIYKLLDVTSCAYGPDPDG